MHFLLVPPFLLRVQDPSFTQIRRIFCLTTQPQFRHRNFFSAIVSINADKIVQMPPLQSTLNTALSVHSNTLSVNLFTNADCTAPFQHPEISTSVPINTCYNVPQNDIKSIVISSEEICADDEELTFLISKELNCPSPHTITLKSLRSDSCRPFTSSTDCTPATEHAAIKSMKVVCRPIEKEEEETNILESPPPPRRRGKRGNEVSVGVNANCCKACVVM